MAFRERRGDEKTEKPMWEKTVRYSGILIGIFVSLIAMFVFVWRQFNYTITEGIVTGKCKQGYVEGVEISFFLGDEEYTDCIITEEAKRLQLGSEVTLRVLNGFTSFVWIEKTKSPSGTPPHEDANQ